ncbi:hypothetical protein ARMSODRAFT_1028335 [Armillaria solidipes]|uniref:Uncharacterized protein n=1 Tax=Armillaria solidipes TaxID=1076256 RepID=A0A2H3B3A9_9AGAR|nr:hypothetical protein ARMSODRAFT_1028335 [Armillaria solidipes]
MSAAALPSRSQCIHDTGTDNHCHCPQFAPTLLDPYICANCVHGIHTHVDYVSMVAIHYPPTRCAAFVQKTPLTQCCTCEAQLHDHIAIDNPYRSAEPWNVLDYFPDSDVPSSNVRVASHSNDTINMPNSMPFPSNTANENLMPVTPMPTYSNYIGSHSFSPSCDARSIPFNPTIQSYPSASSALSSIQGPDIAQTQAYSPDNSFVQYRDHVDNNSYARQSSGSAMTGGYEYQYYSNAMYDATPEASPHPYT